MTPLKIQIASAGNPPVFQECQPSEALELVGIGIIEGATAAHRTGVTIVLKKGDKYFHAQTTGTLFVIAADAVKGAKQRFGDPGE
jgi:hypothetical protein